MLAKLEKQLDVFRNNPRLFNFWILDQMFHTSKIGDEHKVLHYSPQTGWIGTRFHLFVVIIY